MLYISLLTVDMLTPNQSVEVLFLALLTILITSASSTDDRKIVFGFLLIVGFLSVPVCKIFAASSGPTLTKKSLNLLGEILIGSY